MVDTPEAAGVELVEDAAVPPPLALRVLLGLALAMGLFPAAFAVHYVREWWNERAGLSLSEQRALFANTPWFQPAFLATVEHLSLALPADARLLVTPSFVEPGLEAAGRGRWYLFLAYACYPRRIYVRQPRLASGTLVDYPRWVRHHTDALGIGSTARPSLEALLARDELAREEGAAIAERGIEWELRCPIVRDFDPDKLELYRKQGERWEKVELPSREALLRTWVRGAPGRARARAGASAGDGGGGEDGG